MNEVRISYHLQYNYDDYYQHEDPEWRRLGALGKVDNLVSLCADLPHGSILEIGAGDGSLLQRLSELNFGAELHALDISPSGVAAIQNKDIPRLAGCQVFDGYRIPYESDRFDRAVLSHVIEHVEHPRQLLYEASRIARHVFVEVPLEDTLRLSRDFVPDAVGHINFYSPKTIRRLAQSCGLPVIRQIVSTPPKETYRYQRGTSGVMIFHAKRTLLALLPGIATKLATFHSALLCGRALR